MTLGNELVLVTGATSGIGHASAAALLARGARLVLHARTLEKAAVSAAALRERFPEASIETVAADLADLDAVRAMAIDLRTRFGRLDALIHNAGLERWERALAPMSASGHGGHELTFTVNHLAPFLLTHELLPLLRGARVIFVSSLVHQWGEIHWDDLDARAWYSPEPVYYQSKLASLLAGMELARRLAPQGTQVLFAPPGMTRTNFARDFRGFPRIWSETVGERMFRDPARVGEEYAELALGARFAGLSGAYVDRLVVGHPAPVALDRGAQVRMWTKTCALLGLEPEWLPPAESVAPFVGPVPTRPAPLGWMKAVVAGELVGFTAVALIGVLAIALFGPPESVGAHVVAAFVMALAGLLEGASLGYFEWRALRPLLPRLRLREWVAPTALVASVGWLLGMFVPVVGMLVAPTELGEQVAETSGGPGPLATAAFAAIFGAMVGAIFGFAQWWVLRRHAARPTPWVAFNALGWALGLPITYVAGGLGSPEMSIGAAALLALGAAGVMGLGVALGTLPALARLAPKPV